MDLAIKFCLLERRTLFICFPGGRKKTETSLCKLNGDDNEAETTIADIKVSIKHLKSATLSGLALSGNLGPPINAY